MQLSFFTVHAQDIEQVTKAKWVTVTGGIGATGSGYTNYGIQNRRDPFAYNLSANLNFNFKGVVDAPFSMYIASENKTFNAPSYNFVGISPRYKWITAHIGSRNMNMSQFTYSGTTFLGGGIELMPEKFIVKGKAFYGRLVKVVPVGDTLSPIIRLPVYERWGGAGMVTIGSQSNNVDIIFFKGKDDIHSLGAIDSTSGVKPEENMVLGLNTKQKIGDHLLLALEYGFSAYTRDTRQPDVTYDNFTYANNFGSLFRPKASSLYAHALSVRADYQADIFTVGIVFHRIDPNYQTMGALYMTNNVQDITINAAAKLLQNKINVSGSFGYQQNNLDNKSEATDKRFISNFNMSYVITENLNFSLNFSNYNTSTEAVQILVRDSIKYAQINNNFSVNVSYVIPGGEKLQHSFDFSIIMQNANTVNNEFTQIENTNNQMNGINAGYRLGFVETDWNIGLNTSVNQNKMAVGNDFLSSAGVSVNKGFLKKTLRATLGFTALFSDAETTSSNINTTRLTLSYRFFKKHSINFNTNYMHRIINTTRDGKKTAGEVIGTIAYSYSF
jgi:hypothetical protein